MSISAAQLERILDEAFLRQGFSLGDLRSAEQRKSKKQARIEAYQALADRGLTKKEAAEVAQASYRAFIAFTNRHGIGPFVNGRGGHQRRGKAS
ncbi:MAG: hypothetical protein AAFQ04_12440 [Pseudomonadota bacterium]